MTGSQNLPRRRDVLRATAVAGLLGATGTTLTGAATQDQAQAQIRTYSYSLQEGDAFRVRYRPHDPAGNPVTETVPAACLGTEEDEEFQLFIVEAYRDQEFIGYRSLMAPVERLAPEVLETGEVTETADGGTETTLGTATETTEAALQDETTTAVDGETTAVDGETTAAAGETTTVSAEELPEVEFGRWYRVASSEACDGLFRLLLESTEAPEVAGGPGTTAAGGETTEAGAETETEAAETTTET